MYQFKIVTDSTADLSQEYLDKYQIGCMHLSCILGDDVYGREKKISPKDLFDRMRNGEMPSTSQINPDEAKAYFEEFAKTDQKILYLAFSSGLSGTCESGISAAKELKEERPELQIIVIDTLCAALGEGLIVHKAVMMREEGKSMEEIAEWVRLNHKNVIHCFTVDDLHHLHRGGRVSKTAAVVGTLVGIKPLLHVNDTGHLILMGKVRGRKKSLDALVDHMVEKTASYETKNDIVTIGHGDCLEDAEYVASQIRERLGVDEFMIDFIGPIIGTHTGPGVIALFFMGDSRE